MHSVLCSAHFKSDDYFGQSKYTSYEPKAKFLKKTAVPSIFSFTKTKLETTLAKQRQERLEKRCRKKLMLEEPTCSKDYCEISTKNNEIFLSTDIAYSNEVELKSKNEEISLPLAECVFYSKGTQVDNEHMFGIINRYKNDDRAIQFYTGFESYRKFYFVYSTLSPVADKINYYGSKVLSLSTEDQLFLTLIKLRQNKCIFELSRFFNISTTTASNIFITWVNFIYQLWSKINIWPDKDLVQYYMPDNFKKYNRNVRVILDGTEIQVQKPKHPTGALFSIPHVILTVRNKHVTQRIMFSTIEIWLTEYHSTHISRR
ncbi:uncharacterized protein LOC119193825 [Manduca sexta]|uniref:uncharacterized protein LOC119193825 n=1 Tax=Manduca sexta TaxID=7130 RepID=UPI00188FE56B|nr:uncharacterized protein LOC119193825 [Manduca sexta]